jgi:hypothetical protein
VAVYPPADDRDEDAGPQRGRGEPTSLACAVQRTTQTTAESRRMERHDGLESEADFNLIFAERPPVAGVDVDIAWTHHGGVALAEPVWLLSLGPAEPPGGLSERWTVAARRNTE